jgi:hypothetical protein
MSHAVPHKQDEAGGGGGMDARRMMLMGGGAQYGGLAMVGGVARDSSTAATDLQMRCSRRRGSATLAEGRACRCRGPILLS